jgi:aspartate aminotransferase-like enzyme
MQLDSILSEGLERRFARHSRLAKLTRKWAKSRGFPVFAEKGYESDTLTCMENTPGIDMEKVQGLMAMEGYGMDTGYRKLNERLKEEGKPLTFRIAHMGDLTAEELKEFLGALDESIRKAGG